jgi:hypothetical protein
VSELRLITQSGCPASARRVKAVCRPSWLSTYVFRSDFTPEEKQVIQMKRLRTPWTKPVDDDSAL